MVKTVRQGPEPGSEGQQHQQEGQILPFLQAYHKTEGMFFHQASADQFVVHGTHAPAPGGTAAELLHPFLRIKFIIRGPAALMDGHTVFSTNSRQPHTTTSASFFSAAPSRRENILRSTRSSGSTKPTYFPSAAISPAFRARGQLRRWTG